MCLSINVVHTPTNARFINLCNAQRCITGKRWIDIWLVFINVDFETRFDNFTRATCILYIDLVETLNFLPRQCTKYKLHVENYQISFQNSNL